MDKRTLRDEVAARLLNRDGGGHSLRWTRRFISNEKDGDHEGDCPKAANQAPITCCRCVVDGAHKDADDLIRLVLWHILGEH